MQYSVIVPSAAGAVEAFTPVTASDTFRNTGKTILAVKNGGATDPVTVTIASKVTCNQGYTHDLTVTVAAGETKLIGPLPTARFNDPTTDLATVGYSAVTSISAMVLQV